MYATLYCYNLYQPGQGIMAHQDGPLYTPKVAILSLVGRKKKKNKTLHGEKNKYFVAAAAAAAAALMMMIIV